MAYDPRGVKFVLTAPDTESTEQAFSPWKQMVYASTPARLAPRFTYKHALNQQSHPDGTAVVMPFGVRIVEAILREDYPADDIAVCHPDNLGRFVGPRTRAVGIAAHNPIGVAFSTGVYSSFFGSSARPVNAAESERVFRHPALRKYGPKIIVGGAGAWQIETLNAFDRLKVDCVIIGRCEAVVADLFRRADEGGELPRVVRAPEPSVDQLRIPGRRSTYGIVEMTRGCGRQCSFCSPTLEKRISVPAERLLEAIRGNAREGGRVTFPISEDIFIYGASAPFYIPNANALVEFYEKAANIPGIDYVMLSHATIAPALVNPHLIKELSRILLRKSPTHNAASTHPDKKFLSPLIGIETGSARLAAQIMPGKALPFDIRDWQEIVVEGLRVMNENNWFPVCSYIVGTPEETDDDIKASLDLLYRLRKHKIIHTPSIFTPLEETRLAHGHEVKHRGLTKLQWELVLTAWRQTIDFIVKERATNRQWKMGMYAFYYTRGRWTHGSQFKYPALRFAGVPEEKISRHLYLNWDTTKDGPDTRGRQPRLIRKHSDTTLDGLSRVQEGQPFSVFGKSRM